MVAIAFGNLVMTDGFLLSQMVVINQTGVINTFYSLCFETHPLVVEHPVTSARQVVIAPLCSDKLFSSALMRARTPPQPATGSPPASAAEKERGERLD